MFRQEKAHGLDGCLVLIGIIVCLGICFWVFEANFLSKLNDINNTLININNNLGKLHGVVMINMTM